MAGPTLVGDIDSIIQVMTAEVQVTARQMPLMRRLVRVLNFPENKGSPIDRPKLGKLTAFSLVEGADIAAPQALTDTDVSINPTEVGLQVVLTDRMLSRAPRGFEQLVSGESARAYAEKLDGDLLGLFSGFSRGLSAAGSAITLGNVGAGRSRVKAASEPGPDPLYYVFHPYSAWDIQAAITPLIRAGGTTPDVGAMATTGAVGDEVLRRGLLGTLFGVPVFESGLIAVDSDDDVYNVVASKEAIMLFVTDEGSVRRQRDESLRAWELNYVGEYGFGEWVDSYGYFFLVDATAPTV